MSSLEMHTSKKLSEVCSCSKAHNVCMCMTLFPRHGWGCTKCDKLMGHKFNVLFVTLSIAA